MTPNGLGIKLRLTLSQNGAILCTAHNRGEEDASIKHSAIYNHTDLYIFQQNGKSLDFEVREASGKGAAKDRKGHPVVVPAMERAHLSHSRIIFDNKGNWGITWGRMRYRNLPQGIYYFVASHKETMSSNFAIFEIALVNKAQGSEEIAPDEYWPKDFTTTHRVTRKQTS